MKRPCTCAALLAFLALAACSGTTEDAQDRVWSETDSAGVTLVDNQIRKLGAGEWSVGTDPLLVIGGLAAPEEQQLFQMDGATRLADGRIAVASAGTHDVRVFAPDGTLAARFGAEGDGPGEFRDATLLGRYGPDTLVVFDASSSRISHVHAEMGYLGSVSVRWEGKGYPVGRGLLADGSVLIGGGMSFSSEEGFPTGVIRPPSTFGWVARDGQPLRSLGNYPGAGMFARANSQGFMARGLPFSSMTTVAPGKDGVWLGTADAWEVDFYDLNGVLVRRVRADAPPRAVTPELRRAYEAEEVASAATENEARQIRDLLGEMPFPAETPPYQALITDAAGFLWVEDYLAPGSDTPTWTVLDPQGRAAARLTTPPRTRILEIGEDYILGRSLDELDVESLTLWALRRGPPPP